MSSSKAKRLTNQVTQQGNQVKAQPAEPLLGPKAILQQPGGRKSQQLGAVPAVVEDHSTT